MAPPACSQPRNRRTCEWCGLPRPASHPRWCSVACAEAWATNHQWSRARAAVLVRDRRRCRSCGTRERLQVHHVDPVGTAGYGASCSHHLDNLVLLCAQCHSEAEARRRRAERGTPTQLSLLAA